MIDASLLSSSRADAALEALLDTEDSTVHGYTPAAGLVALRAAVAEALAGSGVAVSSDLLYVTCGAPAGRAILVRALLSAGDEVLFLYPPEADLRAAVEAVGAFVVENGILTERTRLVVLSDSDPIPAGLADALRAAEKAYGQPVYLLADCVSPTEENLSLLRDYDSCVLNGDFGTELAGECIGYLAVSERAREAELLFAAIAGAGRACGYVNPPSLMQRAVEKCLS